LIGGKLEEFLLQTLLKQTKASIDKFKETQGAKIFDNLSTLHRRGFYEVYSIFFNIDPDSTLSEMGNVWINARHNPYYPKPIQATLSEHFNV
jgi:hypothetical protein